MSENSKIEWTDHTFNPWEGCTKVGPGCDHCYAETRNARYAGGQSINWGAGAQRRRTSQSNWNKPVKWNKESDAFFAEHGHRQRVFCASLADVFDNEVNDAWRVDLFQLILATPNLDWLLLTKRIGNVATMAPRLWMRDGWPSNVWLGATVVNQMEADRDINKLLRIRASVRFLSIEPLLNAIDLSQYLDLIQYEENSTWGRRNIGHLHDMVDWVIVGGESGAGARPMHPDWARSLRDQCVAANVPYLFKQWGEWAEITPVAGGDLGGDMRKGKTRIVKSHGENDGHFQRGDVLMSKVGKLKAGRLLDGVTHDGYPVVTR
ncbi:MAG TPA: phage Gp37/Gp68 family protein [Methylotenera sp.]|nr:phage Gp37/Gp68 family protein [Methylotenera sp.]